MNPIYLRLRSLALSALAVAFAGHLSLAQAVSAEVIQPQGDYNEDTVDLSIDIPGGGKVEVDRTWALNHWSINPNWDNLVFEYDDLDGSVAKIKRGRSEYKRVGTSDVYNYDAVKSISKTDSGWRWQDRSGNRIDYTADGRILSNSDKNGNTVTFNYDGSNHLASISVPKTDGTSRTAFTFTWSGSHISDAYDAQSGHVHYTWEGDLLKSVQSATGKITGYGYDSAGKILTRTDPDGRTTTLVYTANGRIASLQISLADTYSSTTHYDYDYDNNLKQYYTRITDPTGMITEERYDEQAQLLRRDVNSETVYLMTQDTATRQKRRTDARGLVTVDSYDEFDNLISTQYPDGSKTSTVWDITFSQPLQTTDELGIVTQYQYDSHGNLTSKIDAFGTDVARTTHYSYTPQGDLQSVQTDADTNSAATYTYYQYNDPRGYLTARIDGYNTAEARTTGYTHDDLGNLTSETDAANHATIYTYYADRQVKQHIDASNRTTTYTYDDNGRLKQIDYPDTTHTQTAWTPLDRIDSTTDQLAHSTHYKYDLAGRLTSTTDPDGLTQTLSYDAAGRIQQTTAPNGDTTVYTWGAANTPYAGLLTALSSSTWQQTMDYDSRDRVVKTTLAPLDPASSTQAQVSTTQYDAAGHVVKTLDPQQRPTQTVYDALGRIKQTIAPDSGSTDYVYDNRDNLLSVSDPIGLKTVYVYDQFNRRTDEFRPGSSNAIHTEYYANDLVKSQTDPNGQKRSYTYNSLNQLETETHTDPQGQVSQTLSYTWDPSDNLYTWANTTQQTGGSFTWYADHRKKTETVSQTLGGNTLTQSHGYTYTPGGRKDSLTYPDNSVTHYSWNKGQVDTITLPDQTLISRTYNNGLPQTVIIPGGGKTQLTWDPYTRIQRIQVTDPGQSTQLNRQYTWSTVNTISQIDTESGSRHYEYDPMDRLTSATHPTLPSEAYTYDKVGNRLTANGSAYTYESTTGQLVNFNGTDDVYDANGNLKESTSNGQTTQYIHDGINRLAQINLPDGSHAEYLYDPFARRIRKTVTDGAGQSTTTLYEYSDEGLIAESDATGQIKVMYGWLPDNTFMTDPQTIAVGGQTYFYHNDHLGTPQTITDAAGIVVWAAEMAAFGGMTVTTQAVVSNLRFPGQYWDQESGLSYNWHRYYDASVGRYVESDPIGLAGGLNRWGYVGGSSNLSIDPTGQFIWAPVAAAVGGVIGGISGAIQAASSPGASLTSIAIGAGTGALSGAIGGLFPVGRLALPIAGAAVAAAMNTAGQLSNIWATGNGNFDPCQVIVQAAIGFAGSSLGGKAGFQVGNQMLSQRIPGGGYVAVMNLAQSVNAIVSGGLGIAINLPLPGSLGGFSGGNFNCPLAPSKNSAPKSNPKKKTLPSAPNTCKFTQ